MTKTTKKTRIIAGILLALSVFSTLMFSAGSASAAEVKPSAEQTNISEDTNEDPYSMDATYNRLKKIVNKDAEEAARKEQEEAADTREGRTVVVAGGVEKEYTNIYEAWAKATAAGEAIVKVNSDLTGVENLAVPAGVKLTVNLKDHTIRADGSLFKVDKGAECTISKGTLIGAKTAVIANGYAKLEKLTISESTDSAVKGFEGSKVSIDGCTFRSNEGVKGGAVYLPYYAEAVIKNSTFEYNNASEEGGAVYTNRGLINCTFKHNKAGKEGGAVYITGNKEFIQKSTFEDNLSDTNGGAAAVSQDYTTFLGCTFKSNRALMNGGAIYAPENRNFGVDGCKIDGNSAANNGGGIQASYRSCLDLSNSEVTGNTAGNVGGGVYLGALFTMDHYFENVVITGNSARLGGGVYADASVASAADIDFYQSIIVKGNTGNDLYLMKDCGKKAKIYTMKYFNADNSIVYVNSSDSSEIAVVDLYEKTDEVAFRADDGRSLKRGFFFNETLYIS